jgi:hypothetical protein
VRKTSRSRSRSTQEQEKCTKRGGVTRRTVSTPTSDTTETNRTMIGDEAAGGALICCSMGEFQNHVLYGHTLACARKHHAGRRDIVQGLVDWREEEDSGCQSSKVVQIFRNGGAEREEWTRKSCSVARENRSDYRLSLDSSRYIRMKYCE